LLSDRQVLGRKDLRFDVTLGPEPWSDDAQLTLPDLERRHIERVLRAEHGRVEQAARRLGIPRSSLYQKIKNYGIVLSKI
jgi:transcriptional regulator of acetoin/glycerol metabolism